MDKDLEPMDVIRQFWHMVKDGQIHIYATYINEETGDVVANLCIKDEHGYPIQGTSVAFRALPNRPIEKVGR